jgi:polysaccharide biosynthesis transport protein
MAENQEAPLHSDNYWWKTEKPWLLILLIFLLVVPIVFSLCVATVYYYTKSIPKIYTASSVIKADRDIDHFKFTADLQVDRDMFLPDFELIQSKRVLNRVIKRLNLQKVFSQMSGLPGDQIMTEDQAYVRLKQEMLSVQPYRNTKLVEIKVSGNDSALCAHIANVIAEEYESTCMEEFKTRTESGLARLRNEMEKQKTAFFRARENVDNLRKELGPSVTLPNGEVLTRLDMELKLKEAQLIDMKKDVLARKVRFDKIKDLSPLGLEAVLPSLGLVDSTIASTQQNLYNNQSFLKSLEKQGFPAEHPRVKSTQAQIAKLRVQLDGLLIGVRRSLEIDLNVSEAKLASFEGELVSMRERRLDNRSDKLRPYEDAVRELDTQMSLYSLLVDRYKQLSVESICYASPVSLIRAAEESFRPVHPNMSLNLGLGAIVGLSLGVTLAFITSLLWITRAHSKGAYTNTGKPTPNGPQ